MMVNGFVRLRRSVATLELLEGDPRAFLVLTLLAYRAKWSDGFNVRGLAHGEGLVGAGDAKRVGLTREQFRGALKRLQRYKLITTRGTNRGTIVRLISSSIYDLSPPPGRRAEDPAGEPASDAVHNHQTPSRQPLTKKERKGKKKINSDVCADLAAQFEAARKLYPGTKRGFDTELDWLRRKHPQEWREIIPALEPAIRLQIANREKAVQQGEFVPNWQHFQTYISQRSWERRI